MRPVVEAVFPGVSGSGVLGTRVRSSVVSWMVGPEAWRGKGASRARSGERQMLTSAYKAAVSHGAVSLGWPCFRGEQNPPRARSQPGPPLKVHRGPPSPSLSWFLSAYFPGPETQLRPRLEVTGTLSKGVCGGRRQRRSPTSATWKLRKAKECCGPSFMGSLDRRL